MEAVALNDQTPNPENADGPLVSVSFQKNPQHVRKYLEAEPKALGVTQITLSVFKISMSLSTLSNGFEDVTLDVIHFAGSLLVIIAGSVAVAAQNLHLPTLRACLGMQVLACAASVVGIFISFFQVGTNYSSIGCWLMKTNGTEQHTICQTLSTVLELYLAEGLLIHTALAAICATLAAYCCKVINCCTPMSKMTVITINTPPAQQ
ncbi:hypothetical protein MATL_G00167390 [Megalops atlanticus]|uniref:Membrane-spanning 4-domains subfamily A member 4A-like n=1 Tax=Megalops atlanticus TaxID=7932 RepID=A0A9D3PN60_MEGAT|nr:hypothetical protein MATL_G00167390 [Megalops atlanticus]